MSVTLEIKSYEFRECASGTYYYETAYLEIWDKVEVIKVENKYKATVNDYSMLQNLKEN